MATSECELLLQREMPFPRELIWKAMTVPEHVNMWWGPDGFRNENVAMDFRVGGVWSYDMVGPDGTRYPNRSVFKEIVQPQRLVYEHGDGSRVWFEASIVLEETAGGTLITLRQLYGSQAARDEVVEKYGAIEGGKQHLAKLERYVSEQGEALAALAADAGLALYGHPFSSYTQKVLIALYENGTPFEFRCLGPDTPQHAAEWQRRWPLHKFPLLVDGQRDVAESSIIIEYLQMAHPGAVRLLPDGASEALDVRFLDRFFDLHVMTPMQHAVGGALTGVPAKREEALAFATGKLELAYGWLERHLAGKTWACGTEFTLADCAAAPSLFYADWTHPIAGSYPLLRAYRARLLARPSFARAVEEARQFRHLFPLGAPQRD
jgi:glutathione S-transferase/uncharacterized protein YndB with AHSA1/START domain